MSNQLVIRKAYVEVLPGKQIHYRYVLPAEGTAQRIPIVYLHKSASSSVSYEKLMLHYAALGYPSYAPDMPGFGGSFDPDETDVKAISEKNTRWYVDLFVKVFEQLGVYDASSSSKQVELIGHHSGGKSSFPFRDPSYHTDLALHRSYLCTTTDGEYSMQYICTEAAHG
jgi:pimeloyl-ACP methyl ester carboxylesterase